jgi:hypothetical protein
MKAEIRVRIESDEEIVYVDKSTADLPTWLKMSAEEIENILAQSSLIAWRYIEDTIHCGELEKSKAAFIACRPIGAARPEDRCEHQFFTGEFCRRPKASGSNFCEFHKVGAAIRRS